MFTKDTYARRNASQKRKMQTFSYHIQFVSNPLQFESAQESPQKKAQKKKIEIKIKCHV